MGSIAAVILAMSLSSHGSFPAGPNDIVSDPTMRMVIQPPPPLPVPQPPVKARNLKGEKR